ncbi:ribose-5-phosphate isomerase A [Streptomyces sp. NPDC056653]|uniref:ribose-5-phosphate isomerase A n=1 Tax=Streptomyces sp. NPDC056653 TaxID=3345894 RepID=UPI00368C6BD2
MSVQHEKQRAAEAAAELIEDGMTVGLGTGSTVAYLLPALAHRGLSLRCVATSPRTEKAALMLDLRVEPFGSIDHFDITIDGADQIAPDGWLVKGGGAAHTREKIVAAAADRFVVIAFPGCRRCVCGIARRGGHQAWLRTAGDRRRVIQGRSGHSGLRHGPAHR